jgi:hypothetical protein
MRDSIEQANPWPACFRIVEGQPDMNVLAPVRLAYGQAWEQFLLIV